MITIHKEILSAEPVRPGSNVYRVTSLEGSISAVQVFPRTLTSEEEGLFNQQVVSLEQAVADYGAALPFVMASGFTAGDYLPYIETEWIEGESFEERMKRNPSSSEALKAAEQISRILTICHKLGLAHGNVAADNILWDKNRNRYTLTDFNLTDQYKDNKEGLMKKDMQDLGALLSSVETKYALQYPAWFTATLNRTKGGAASYTQIGDFYLTVIKNHKEDTGEKRYRSKPQEGAGTLATPQVSKPEVVEIKKPEPPKKKVLSKPVLSKPILSKPDKESGAKTFFTLNRVVAGGFILSLLLLGIYLYSEDQEKGPQVIAANTERERETEGEGERERERKKDVIILPKEQPAQEVAVKKEEKPVVTPPIIKKKEAPVPKPAPVENRDVAKAGTTELPKETEAPREAKEGRELGVYKVRSKAYFHNKPHAGTKRKAFIVHWNNAKLRPLDEEGEFVYIVYTNVEGQTTKGWLAKKDLIPVE